MSLIEAFLSTWSAARATFGDDRPLEGGFPGNVVGRLQSDVSGAGPGELWSGRSADAYGELNSQHAQSFTALADLDRRMTVHLDQLASVVAEGRQQLDDVRRRVVDLAAALPPHVEPDDVLRPVVGQAVDRLVEIIARSHASVTALVAGIEDMADEYRAVTAQQPGGSSS